MKLSAGITAALASCASAAQLAAQVHILPATGSPAALAVPRSVARLILLQRLAPSGKGPSVADLPDNVDADEVIGLLNLYAKTGAPLFGDDEPLPSQLVVMLEGMTEQQIKQTGDALDARAFTVTSPPATKAHDDLINIDFYNAGVTKSHKCSLDEVVNPSAEQCWSGKSTVARYDVSKDASVLKDLESTLEKLRRFSKSGEMEAAIVLLPTVAETSASDSWSDKPQDLRRRQAEVPMSTSHDVEPPVSSDTTPVDKHPVFVASSSKIPACFTTEDACTTGTRNCTGHGVCRNKWAKADGSDAKEVCYMCHCMSTATNSSGVTHWAGATCSKVDVSVPFWLFAGVTLAMIGVVTMAVGMLFSVGEEKLPGVIGAGVSKSK
jgi:hypothetical protein